MQSCCCKEESATTLPNLNSVKSGSPPPHPWAGKTSPSQWKEPSAGSAHPGLARTKCFSSHILQLSFLFKGGTFHLELPWRNQNASLLLYHLSILPVQTSHFLQQRSYSVTHLHSNQCHSPVLTAPELQAYQNRLTFNVRLNLPPKPK